MNQEEILRQNSVQDQMNLIYNLLPKKENTLEKHLRFGENSISFFFIQKEVISFNSGRHYKTWHSSFHFFINGDGIELKDFNGTDILEPNPYVRMFRSNISTMERYHHDTIEKIYHCLKLEHDLNNNLNKKEEPKKKVVKI